MLVFFFNFNNLKSLNSQSNTHACCKQTNNS